MNIVRWKSHLEDENKPNYCEKYAEFSVTVLHIQNAALGNGIERNYLMPSPFWIKLKEYLKYWTIEIIPS